MILKKNIESSGIWLFRWRSFLPLLVLPFITLSLKDYSYPGNSCYYDGIWEVVCIAVGFMGLAIRVLTVGAVPRGTSGRNTRKQKAEQLNTTGLYSTVRNPLYLGNYFMGLGVAMFPFLWYLPVIYTLAFAIYYERIILAEEKFLTDKFGEKYIKWAKSTPVFIPRLSQYCPPEMPFSWRTVLKREYNSFFALVICMTAFEIVTTLKVEGSLNIGMFWISFLVVGFFIWFILRFMKKHTSLLKINGR